MIRGPPPLVRCLDLQCPLSLESFCLLFLSLPPLIFFKLSLLLQYLVTLSIALQFKKKKRYIEQILKCQLGRMEHCRNGRPRTE